jgi:hypothetical protein
MIQSSRIVKELIGEIIEAENGNNYLSLFPIDSVFMLMLLCIIVVV